MPKVKIKANKMTDADVSFISLVGRGANRIPFKIVKKEKDAMGTANRFAGLDLSNLGALFAQKSEKPIAAEVLAVVTMDGEGLESVSKQLSDAGFSVKDKAVFDDQSVVFKQGDMVEGEGAVVRLNEHVAVVLKGFEPYSMDIATEDNLSFQEKCNAQGFWPGVSTVMDVLRSNIIEMAKKGDDATAIAADVGAMFDEAKQYVTGMIRSLPASVFKMEDIIVEKAAKPAKPAVPNAEEGAVDAEFPNETAEEKKARLAKVVVKGASAAEVEAEEALKAEEVLKSKMTPDEKAFFATLEGAAKMAFMTATSAERQKLMGAVKKEEGTGSVEAKETVADSQEKPDTALENEPAALTTEQVSDIVSAQVHAGYEALVEKMEQMLQAVTSSVQKSVEGIQSTVTAMQGQVEQAERVAKSAVEVVKGAVVGGDPAGDHAPSVKKTERVGTGRDFDTAYNSSVRTKKHS